MEKHPAEGIPPEGNKVRKVTGTAPQTGFREIPAKPYKKQNGHLTIGGHGAIFMFTINLQYMIGNPMLKRLFTLCLTFFLSVLLCGGLFAARNVMTCDWCGKKIASNASFLKSEDKNFCSEKCFNA